MRYCSLGSGSEGNAVLVAGNTSAVLVDAGFSLRQINERLNCIGFDIRDVAGIVITHEHIDHIRGAGVMARRHRIPVYATRPTLDYGRSMLGHLPECREIDSIRSFGIGDLLIHPFSLSHDAADPVGYIIEAGGSRLGICTDLGYVTHLVRQRLTDCDGLILEMNHDITMLMAGSYPWPLKQRIRSRQGHLSNDQCGELIRDVWSGALQHLTIAHLSKENNLPDLASLTARQAVESMGGLQVTQVHLSLQNQPGDFLTIRNGDRVSRDTGGGIHD